MKKLIVMGIVMVMVLSASAAFAVVDNDWVVFLKASSNASGLAGASNAIFGLKTTTGNTFASLGTPANLATNPEVNFTDTTGQHPYTSNYGVQAGRWSTSKLGGAPMGDGKLSVIDWTFKVAGGAGTSVYLTAWTQAGATTQLEAGTTTLVKLYASNVAGEKIGSALYTFGQNNTTFSTSTGIAGVAGTNFYQNQYTLGATADGAGGAYQYFVLEATVPEPGSMVALFSGLIGLVGFGIRRRK